MYLENIDTPADVCRLPTAALPTLCAEIRAAIIAECAAKGGHVGSNLGIVELTVALHRVFHSPHDKLVFDVSHQTYAHKMLTGRAAAFVDPAHFGEVSGFANPRESEHDLFSLGHTSTSVGLACGLAKARDLVGEHYDVVAVMGDGSLSGGLAFEGLNSAATLESGLIIIINDNEWSISEDQGGLYRGLAQLRATGGTAPNNLFRAMGLEYHYLEAGNDVAACEAALSALRGCRRPTVLHVHTHKGLGFAPAMADEESWHHVGPFDPKTGEQRIRMSQRPNETYAELTGERLLTHMATQPSLVAITAATPYLMGFTPQRRAAAGDQFIDVGIAEEHAVTYATGLAQARAKPVFGVYATFLQRAYDQLWHDLCLNAVPAVILVFGASAFGTTDATHLGFFDIPLLANMPGLPYLAPTCREEYLSMLDWAITWHGGPVAIRVPGAGVISRPSVTLPADGYAVMEPEVVRTGSEVAVLALGSALPLGERVADKLTNLGVHPTLINPRQATELDEDSMRSVVAGHRLVVTLEDGVANGGFGEHVTRILSTEKVLVHCYGLPHAFPDRYNPEQLLARCRMDEQAIASDIITELPR